jgi:hypothetical protein
MNITKEILKSGKEEMKKLLQYVKEIKLYNGIKATKCKEVDKYIRMISEPKKNQRGKKSAGQNQNQNQNYFPTQNKEKRHEKS